MVQYSNAGLIRYSDLVWLPHVTSGKHIQVESKIAAISWDRLLDFVEGREQNAEYPTTFNRRVKKRNLAGVVGKTTSLFMCTTYPVQVLFWAVAPFECRSRRRPVHFGLYREEKEKVCIQ